MLYRMAPFPMTLSDTYPIFQGHRVTTDALDVFCAQLMHDLFPTAYFLVLFTYCIIVEKKTEVSFRLMSHLLRAPPRRGKKQPRLSASAVEKMFFVDVQVCILSRCGIL